MTNGVIVSLLLAAALGGQAPTAEERPLPTAAKITADEIAAAVARLASNKFAEREAASEFLWRAGRPALEALEAAAKDKDLERSRRATKLLDKVRWGLTPDVDPETATVINAFRLATSHAGKLAVLVGLRKEQRFALIVELILADPQYPKTTELATAFAREIRAAAIELHATEPAQAEALLRRRLQYDVGNLALRDYAAYLVHTGKQAEAEARLQRELKLEPDGNSARLLAQLLLYEGREAEARPIAAATDDEYLKIEIAFRLNDWKAMAEKYPATAGGNLEQLGLAFHFATLAGDTVAAYQARLAIEASPQLNPQQAWLCCEALLLNERWREAEQVVAKSAANRRVELLCDQMRYREALDELGPRDVPEWAARWFAKAGAELAPDKPETLVYFHHGLQVGRALHQVGLHGEVDALFDLLAEKTATSQPAPYMGSLLEMELRLGRRAQAERRVLPLLGSEPSTTVILQKYFKLQSATAQLWWMVLREHFSQEDAAATWRRLKLWMIPGNGSQTDEPPLDVLLAIAERIIAATTDAQAPGRWGALAEFCRLRSDLPRAARYFQKQAAALDLLAESANFSSGLVPATAALLALGDVRFAQEQWFEAAAAYESAWKRRRIDPLPLYLQGRALEKAGQVDAGRGLMRRAELLPLADVELRRTLAAGLQERGLAVAAREQRREVWRLGLRSAWDFHVLYVAETEAKELGRAGIAEAAPYWSYLPYGLFRMNAAMTETLGYRELAQAIHKGRAWAALDAKRWDEAQAELKGAQDARPGYSAFAEAAVQRLDAVGRKAEADAVFERAFGVYADVCRDFPDSAWHHNGAAWLATQCDRRLDDALKHAEAALRLKPNTAAYLDTLAEVHFRRGDAARAVEIETEAVKLAPDDPEIAEQMKKFRAAVKKS